MRPDGSTCRRTRQVKWHYIFILVRGDGDPARARRDATAGRRAEPSQLACQGGTSRVSGRSVPSRRGKCRGRGVSSVDRRGHADRRPSWRATERTRRAELVVGTRSHRRRRSHELPRRTRWGQLRRACLPPQPPPPQPCRARKARVGLLHLAGGARAPRRLLRCHPVRSSSCVRDEIPRPTGLPGANGWLNSRSGGRQQRRCAVPY